MGLEKALLTSSVLLFCSIALGSVFASHCATIWLKNRREDRSRQHKREEARFIQRADAEREEWSKLLTEKDAQIGKLLDEIGMLTSALDRTKVLLQKSEEMRGVRG